MPVFTPTLFIRLPGTSTWVDYSDFLVQANQSGGGIVGGGSVSQVSSLLTDSPVTKVHTLNTPPQLGFALGQPLNGGAWTKPPRWSEVRLDTPEFEGFFTGFITNEPAGEPMGEDSDGTQLVAYHYTAIGEEILLDMNAIGVIPPFINETDGSIVKKLIARLSPSVGSPPVSRFDTTFLELFGSVNAIFSVNPQERFSDVLARLFANQSVRILFMRGKVFLGRYGDGVFYLADEDNDTNFGPYDLNLNPVPSSLRNDLTGFGAIERKEYAREYMVADGVTANWPLKLPVFGAEGTPLFGDDFSAAAIDTTHWILKDPTGIFTMFGGSLNIFGTAAALGDSEMLLTQGLEIKGKHKINGGEYQFVGAQDGIVCALYMDSVGIPPALTLANCNFGFRLTPSGSQTAIQAIVNGALVGEIVTTQAAKSYAFHIYIDSQVTARRWKPWWSKKNPFGGGIGNGEFVVTFLVEENDQLQVKAPTKYQIHQETVPGTYSGSPGVPAMPEWLYIGLASVVNMNCAVNFFTVTETIQATLLMEEPVLLGSPAQLGPPPGYGSPPIFQLKRGIMGFVGETDADASIQVANQADSLSFFQETIPTETTLIELAYRGSGAAVARVINQASITSQAAAFGDGGVRADVLTNILPLPETSEILEAALQAFLDDQVNPQFDGDWTILAPPYTSVLDLFNRADQNPLTNPWTAGGGALAALQIVSKFIRPATTGSRCAMYWNFPVSANQFAEISLNVIAGISDVVGPAILMNGAGGGLAVSINGPLGSSQTAAVILLTGTIQATFTIVPSVADVIRIQNKGTTVSVFQNGNLLLSYTDTNFTSGFPGVLLRANSSVGDTIAFGFAGGEFDGLSGGFPFPGRFARIISGKLLGDIGQYDALVQTVQTDIVTHDLGSPIQVQYVHKLSFSALPTRRMDKILQLFTPKPPAPETLVYNPTAATIAGVDTNAIPTQFTDDLTDVKLIGRLSTGSPAKLQYAIDAGKALGANQFYEVRWSDANWGQDGNNLIGRFTGSSLGSLTEAISIADDTFTRADANPIGGNWTTTSGFHAIQLLGNKAQAVTTFQDACAYWNANSFNNDQYSEVVIPFINDLISYAGPAVRCSASQVGYQLYVGGVLGTLCSLFLGTGLSTTLATFHYIVNANDAIRLTVIGNLLTVSVNGVTVGTFTDSTYPTGGAPGIVFQAQSGTTGTAITHFEGGNIVSIGGSTDFAIDRVRRDEWIFVKLLDKNFTPWRLSRHPAFVRMVYPMPPAEPTLESIDLTDTTNPILHFGLGDGGEISDVYKMQVRDSDDLTVLETVSIFAESDLVYQYANTKNLAQFTLYIRLMNLLGEYSPRLEAAASIVTALLPPNAVGANQLVNPGFEISSGAYATSAAVPTGALVADSWYAFPNTQNASTNGRIPPGTINTITPGDNTFLSYVEKNGNARTGGRNAYITLNRALTSLSPNTYLGGFVQATTILNAGGSLGLGGSGFLPVRGGDTLYFGGWAKWSADAFLPGATASSISSISKSGNIISVTTFSAHGQTTGKAVDITGTFGYGDSYDGQYPLGVTVIDATHFTFEDYDENPKATITGHGAAIFPGDALAYVGFTIQFYDVDGIFVTSTFYNVSDPNINSDITNVPTNSWQFLSGLADVPQTAAYAILVGGVNLHVFNTINPSLHNYLEVRFDDIFLEKANRGTHSDYAIIGNPLTAHDDGVTGSPPVDNQDEIDIAAFLVSSGGMQASNSSGTILFCQRRTLYYVYYDDPDFKGGAVAYQATEDQAIAKLGENRFFVGSILTPSLGAPDSFGNFDGGHGSAPLMGSIMPFSPGIPQLSPPFPLALITLNAGSTASVTNQDNCLDMDDTTFAELTATNTSSGLGSFVTLVMSLAPGVYRRTGSYFLYIDFAIPVNTVSGTRGNMGPGLISSALNTTIPVPGAGVMSVIPSAATVARHVESCFIPALTNISSLEFSIACYTGANFGTTTIRVYRIWLQGFGG